MRATCVLAPALLALSLGACSDSGGGPGVGGGAGGESTSGEGGATAGGTGGDDGGGASGATGTTSTGGGSSGGGSSTSSSAGTTATSSTGDATSTSTSTGGGDDPYAAERQTCVDTINALRATEGLPPYERWTAAEACSDEAATSDEQSNQPHGSFPSCGESAQNECLGHGPSGIEQCLNQMWDERLLPECSGCADCHDAQGNCPDCVFQSCGHYVNMSALYFSQVACGFSSLGGWDVQNFR